MERGWIKLYRKLLDSRVFQNEGLLKVWLWCLLKASHQEEWFPIKTGRGATEVNVKLGQFVFGRYNAAEELLMSPSTVWKRIKKLKNIGNCDIKSNRQYSIITVINWPIYQGDNKKGDSESNHQVTTKEHIQECKEINIPEKISQLIERYTNPMLINQAFDAIRLTRKTGKVAESIILAQLEKWNRYPVEQVEAGIRVYLDKDCASDGKDEKYLLGIIRNQKRNEQSGEPLWWSKIPD